jgi:hypothetical protein
MPGIICIWEITPEKISLKTEQQDHIYNKGYYMKTAIYETSNKIRTIVKVLGHPGEGFPRGVTRIELPNGEQVNIWKTHLFNLPITPKMIDNPGCYTK